MVNDKNLILIFLSNNFLFLQIFKKYINQFDFYIVIKFVYIFLRKALYEYI